MFACDRRTSYASEEQPMIKVLGIVKSSLASVPVPSIPRNLCPIKKKTSSLSHCITRRNKSSTGSPPVEHDRSAKKDRHCYRAFHRTNQQSFDAVIEGFRVQISTNSFSVKQGDINAVGRRSRNHDNYGEWRDWKRRETKSGLPSIGHARLIWIVSPAARAQFYLWPG